MENTKHLSLGMKSKFEVIEKVNDEFSKVKVYVAAVGTNRNGSYISKETMDAALPSLAYLPVVAHVFKNENGETVVGGHDAELVIDENGYNLKDLTVPYGCVIDNSWEYEEQEEYGKKLTYLVVYAYLWTGRYSDILDAVYSDDIWFNHSMEINFEDCRPYESDSNFLEILGMNFSALCILGKSDESSKNTTPCFISSRVEPVKFSLDNDFSMAFSEMKEKLAFCLKDNKFQEGGNILTKELIDAIIAEYELSMEELDFEIVEGMTEEDFRAKLDDFKKKKKCSAEDAPVEDTFALKFSATYGEKRDALRNALDPIYVRNDDGNIVSSTYFYIQDFDDAYVYVEREFYSDDNWEETNGRFTYTFDSTTKTATITSEFEQMILKWLTMEEAAKLESSRQTFEAMKSEFDEYKANHSIENAEADELKSFKAQILADQRVAEEEAVFTKFEDKLGDVAEYSALKADCKNISVQDIENKCFALLGKKLAQFSMNTKSKNNTIKVPVANNFNDENSDTPYGDVYAKYLKK